MFSKHRKPFGVLTALAAALTLAACGGGGGGRDEHGHGDHDHDEIHIETAGRLALAAPGDPGLRIVDLDDLAQRWSFTLDHAPSQLYASPSGRYAVAVQRLQDQVQFVDGGVWQEDHVDHLHDYREAPRASAFRLAGVRPTHYEAHGGQAALFMDGLVDPQANAEVVLLSDDGIGESRSDARLPLPINMHGTGEVRGTYLLTTWRDPDAATTLPRQVELYRRDGQSYVFVERFDAECPGLHGSFSSARHTVFGCSDGVLVVTQEHDQFVATKLDNPSSLAEGVRIGSFVGSKRSDRIVGIAGQQQLFAIDADAGKITSIDWTTDRLRRAQSFDRDGATLMVLDDLGMVHLLDAEQGWQRRALLSAVGAMPQSAPFPAITASQARAEAYVTDPAGQRVVVIDTADAVLASPIALDFAPVSAVWLGIPR